MISLIVPSYNRLHTLDLIWESWLKQDGDLIKQIILIDDCSEDDYTTFIKKLNQGCNEHGVELVYVKNKNRLGSPACKNKALEFVSQPYVLTTDDDITLKSDMTKNLYTKASKGKLIGSKVIYLRDGESIEDATKRSAMVKPLKYIDKLSMTLTPDSAVSENNVLFVTAVALWPTEVFKKGLRWFENYGGNGYREETDPQIEAQKSYGLSIDYLSDAVCYHLPPSLAYAKSSGQRRGSRVWFEYWTLKNNDIFIKRHASFLKQNGISVTRLKYGLVITRLKNKLAKLIKTI